MASTLHFLKALSVAASTESMINASGAAAEKVLQLGTSNIYKKAVRVRNAFATVQFLLREKCATKKSRGTTGALEPKTMDEKIVNSGLIVDNEGTFSNDNVNHFMGDQAKGKKESPFKKESRIEKVNPQVCNQVLAVTTEILTNSPLALQSLGNLVRGKEESNFTEDSSSLPDKQHVGANDDPLNQMPSTSAPLGNVAGFDLVKLDIEQKRLFKLRYRVREALRRTREQEESLKNRETVLYEKEYRVKLFAEQLKKQQAQLSYQLKKHQEDVKLSNNFGDDEHSISGKNELTRFQLKEREERILRLERKLQKLQSRLLKKQQDHDLSVALHHVTPGIANTEIDETRYCCRSMQTDSTADLTVKDSRTTCLSRMSTIKFEPFLFCDDTKVLFTHATEEPTDYLKLAAAKKCKAKLSRRWQRIVVHRRNHHSCDTNLHGSIPQKSSCNPSGVNVNYNFSLDESRKVESPYPQSSQSEEVVPINSLDSNNLEQTSLLPCSIPETTIHRDVVSVATKADAASVYRGYKFSFDLGVYQRQNAVFPPRRMSKLPIVQEVAVGGCSQMLEKFDQQIQGALNNI